MTAPTEAHDPARSNLDTADPYEWLENARSPRTIWWSKQQQTRAEHALAALPETSVIDSLLDELATQEVPAVPVTRAARQFMEVRASRPYPVLRVIDSAGDRILLDPSGGRHLTGWMPDWAGERVAYQVCRHGEEAAELRVADVRTGADSPLRVKGLRYSPLCWLSDDQGLLYVRSNEAGREVHRLMVDGRDEPLPGLGCGSGEVLWLTSLQAGRQAVVYRYHPGQQTPSATLLTLHDHDLSSTQPLGCVSSVQAEASGSLVAISDSGEVLRRSPTGPWTVLVEKGLPRVDALRVVEPVDASPALALWRRGRLELREPTTGNLLSTLPLPATGEVTAITQTAPGCPLVSFAYTDPVTPREVHTLRVTATPTLSQTGRRGNRPYTKRLRCPESTVDILMLSSTSDTDDKPTVLTTYGGFGVDNLGNYDAIAEAWVRAGGVWAIADVTGGPSNVQPGPGGKLAAVQDLLSAALLLHPTRPGRLALLGGSNGGLIAASAMLKRPHLFAALACVAAPLDMLRYDQLGMGRMWVAEYGDPNDRDQFALLQQLSPYHGVHSNIRYPATLLIGLAADTRVDPAHGRKMCAALQHVRAPTRLWTLPKAGHGRRSRDHQLQLASTTLRFLAGHTGLRPSPA